MKRMAFSVPSLLYSDVVYWKTSVEPKKPSKTVGMAWSR